MEGLEVTVLLGLTILVGTLIAPRVRLALPLVLVILGLALGFIPPLREVQLPPETVLLLFLPVMLFWESLTTSLRSIRRDFRYIVPMSTLLVVASAFAVAGIGVLFGMPWEIALILGAAVAPPDATAVAALGRLLPRRMFMKLKAESLTNDGTALVLYAIAVSLALGGQVTPLSVTWDVLVSYVGGIAAGIVVAALATLLLRRISSTIVINVTLLLVPFSAFLIAELVHASGVLAVVVAGLIVAWVSPRVTTAASRRQADAAWPFGVFLLNGALFVLIGLEVQFVAHEISAAAIGRLVLVTLAVWATLFAVRYVFQLLNVLFQRRPAERPPRGARSRARLVSTVAGMRGAVSLAIALSVPTGVSEGSVVGGRDEIVFVTAGVILLSLLVQAPLLPALVRWARFPVDHAEDEEYELAERAISGAALAALDDLAAEHGIGQEVRDRVRAEGYQALEFANARTLAREQALIDAEAEALDEMLGEPDPYGTGGDARSREDEDAGDVAVSAGTAPDPEATDGTTLQMIATSADVDLAQRSPLVRHEEHTRLKLALLDRKREVLLGLRGAGTVDDMVVRRISARLDLEQVRLQGIEELD
ncbi:MULTISPECIES: Na+/H+ antiporter [unclassified Microbacterium]|uniref:Na+/H+ antiporter n=1 Tax=unclassified Microbacterium TaxID=2609290 RepID=UPI0021A305E3|nr:MULTISPECIES: Na+/H+ antiporter [unclassified Microbacterium]MCT1363231.1 Na+/H+ antiporter [Microbacterium sp. p3-SID131]MCT1378459.1 Na+/H+ antiporter [Microbacterium sp. p3-SID337]MDH5133426.1 Na+/H+ antiporter [Microbacterium sp. RD10]MDH5137182.1 Na+/H+ antiporter [Microbacterium sp. RD11]MDH5144527.1 Na+/H+ antiporter [Microbacterium sp. RD12]